MRQMQGGKREEACLERRRLDNAVESGVEGSGRYIAMHTIPIQSPLKPMSYGQGRIVLQQQHAAKNIPALIPYTIVACGTMKKPTVRKTKIVNEVIKLHANQMLHSLCEWASKVRNGGYGCRGHRHRSIVGVEHALHLLGVGPGLQVPHGCGGGRLVPHPRVAGVVAQDKLYTAA